MERFFDSTSSSIDFSFSFRVVVRGFVNSLCVHVLIRAELEEGEIHLVVSQMNEILEMV